MTPKLNVCVPTTFIPVAGELPVVAPVSAQVKVRLLQLSEYVGAGLATFAVQVPGSVKSAILPGQFSVGATLS